MIVTTAGCVGSVLYVVVTVMQIRLYGFRVWYKHGLGMGEEYELAKTESEDMIHRFTHDVDSVL